MPTRNQKLKLTQLDLSHKDRKYFIDDAVYNCPFCNRRNVKYLISDSFNFWWTRSKKCYGYIVTCSDCSYESMHLSYFNLVTRIETEGFSLPLRAKNPSRVSGQVVPSAIELKNSDDSPMEIDDAIFHKQPSAFFTIDDRIPSSIREPLNEADNCRLNNWLTGGSACLRRAIYELLRNQEIPRRDGSGNLVNYDERIDALRKKLPGVDGEYFNLLKLIKGLASDELHEDPWEDFNNATLRLLIQTTKEILYSIYVEPDERKNRKTAVQRLHEAAVNSRKKKEAGVAGVSA